MRIIAFISDASDVGEMPIYMGDPQTWGPPVLQTHGGQVATPQAA